MSDKFMIVKDQPYLAPHKCASCHTQKITEYIDFGLNIPRYGRVYFCIECLQECFRNIEQVGSVNQVFELNERIDTLKEENDSLRNLLDLHLASLCTYLGNVYPKPEVDESVQRTATEQTKRGPGRPKRTE